MGYKKAVLRQKFITKQVYFYSQETRKIASKQLNFPSKGISKRRKIKAQIQKK